MYVCNMYEYVWGGGVIDYYWGGVLVIIIIIRFPPSFCFYFKFLYFYFIFIPSFFLWTNIAISHIYYFSRRFCSIRFICKKCLSHAYTYIHIIYIYSVAVSSIHPCTYIYYIYIHICSLLIFLHIWKKGYVLYTLSRVVNNHTTYDKGLPSWVLGKLFLPT